MEEIIKLKKIIYRKLLYITFRSYLRNTNRLKGLKTDKDVVFLF